MFNELGIPPTVKVLQTTWGKESDKHWQMSVFPNIAVESNIIEVFDGNEANGERMHALSVAMNIEYAPDPMDIIPNTLIYTEEESDEWSSVRAALASYLQESEVLFAVGQYDPNSDDDWNAFLSELEVLQYKELMALDEVVYKRTMGIE